MSKAFLYALAVSSLSLPGTVQASTVVDTGRPAGTNGYSLNDGQSLAGYFSLSNATTINGVQGYISNFSPTASVTATLYSDAAVPLAANVVFTTTFLVPTGGFQNYDWFGATGLNWAVGAGNYWLSFATNTGMTMLDGAPSPLIRYAFSDGPTYRQANGLGLGIRVFDNAGAVPETATWGMMIAGFGMIGAAMRTRRRSTKVTFA